MTGYGLFCKYILMLEASSEDPRGTVAAHNTAGIVLCPAKVGECSRYSELKLEVKHIDLEYPERELDDFKVLSGSPNEDADNGG